MLIGELMQRTDVSRDTIRHYEAIGLLHEAHFTRRENGYRDYNEGAIERIMFIKKAQSGGFTLNQILTVADEWESNELLIETKLLILSKQLDVIDERIADLESLKDQIRYLMETLITENAETA